MQFVRERRGFTLIEILVVVALLGILAGFVAPLIGESRRDAMRSAVRMQLAIVREQIEIYAAFHSGSLPERGMDGAQDLTVFWKTINLHNDQGPSFLSVPELPDGFEWSWNGLTMRVRYTGSDELLAAEAAGW
ncbi:MAG: type II secretion system protein [Phycisphaerales bacterium]